MCLCGCRKEKETLDRCHAQNKGGRRKECSMGLKKKEKVQRRDRGEKGEKILPYQQQSSSKGSAREGQRGERLRDPVCQRT